MYIYIYISINSYVYNIFLYIFSFSKRYANASDILKYTAILKSYFKCKPSQMEEFKGLSQTVNALRKNFNHYFEKYETDESLINACFLDPNNKLRYWPNSEEDSRYSLKSIRQQLFEAYDKYGPPDDTHTTTNTSDEDIHEDSPDNDMERDTKFNITHWADNNFPATQSKDPAIQNKLPQLSNHELIDLEIKSYLDSETPTHENPIRWWKINRDRLPKLAVLANKYLCAPASSVESERLFSVGGRIYTPLRSRLLPKHGEMLMTLSHNIRHFPEHSYE